jgi:hypothetical protein
MDKSDREARRVCLEDKNYSNPQEIGHDPQESRGLFRPGFGRLTASGRAMHITDRGYYYPFLPSRPVAVPVVYTHNMAIIEITLDRHLSVPPRRRRPRKYISLTTTVSAALPLVPKTVTPLNASVIMAIGIPRRQVVDVKWSLTPELVLSMAELGKGDRLIFEHSAREM